MRERWRQRFEKMVREEGRKVYHLAYRLCGNKEEAEDISQEVFLRVFEKAGFRGESSAFTYLYRVTFNVWKNHIRKKSRCPIRTMPEKESWSDIWEPVDSSPSPEQAFLKEEKARCVWRCLDALSPSEKYILILREVEGKTYEEIAKIIRCPVGTVRSRISRARVSLRGKALPFIERLKK
jgi:RNA polymerase sigma-70 factor (ECF subfamily)